MKKILVTALAVMTSVVGTMPIMASTTPSSMIIVAGQSNETNNYMESPVSTQVTLPTEVATPTVTVTPTETVILTEIVPTDSTDLKTVAELGLTPDPILGGATITMFESQTEAQMLSMIIETSAGSLIVVDGGLGTDAEYLAEQIRARGGHVSAWLLTHPHGDHVGAIYEILQAGGLGLTIDGIYYSFADADWYPIHDADEQTMAVSLIGTFAGLPDWMLNTVTKGQIIQVDDIMIEVMNSRYELSEDTGNNAGIVFKMTINGVTVMLLGDIGEAAGNRLLQEVGAEALKADIVQMAHHGQNGVGEAVYQAINPSICLWPTPDWLWENRGDMFRTPETKSWLSKLGTQLHYCTKDGNQVIY